MVDLKNQTAIKLKGLLFFAIGILAGGILLSSSFSIVNLILLTKCIWAFCRFYYFAFYVLQHYVDPDFNYTGLYDLVKYLLLRKHSNKM